MQRGHRALAGATDLKQTLLDGTLQVGPALGVRQVAEVAEVLDVVLSGEGSAQGHAHNELRRHRRQRHESIVDFCSHGRSHRANALLADAAVVDLEVLDAGAQVAHGVRVVPESHQLLNTVDAGLVVFEPHARTRPQRVKARMRATGDAIVPGVGRRHDHARDMVVEQMPEYRNGCTVVLVGPAQVRVDETLDVRGQLDELFTLGGSDSSAGFHRLAPELLVAQADVEPMAQHQVGDVPPPGVHAVERVQPHACQASHTVVGCTVAGSQLAVDQPHRVQGSIPANERLDDLAGLVYDVYVEITLEAKVVAEMRSNRQEGGNECGRIGPQGNVGRYVNGTDLLTSEVELHANSVTVELSNASRQVHERVLTLWVGDVQSHAGVCET